MGIGVGYFDRRIGHIRCPLKSRKRRIRNGRTINRNIAGIGCSSNQIDKIFLRSFCLTGGNVRIQIMGKEVHRLRPMSPRRNKGIGRIAIEHTGLVEYRTRTLLVLATTRGVVITHNRRITTNVHLRDTRSIQRQGIGTLTLIENRKRIRLSRRTRDIIGQLDLRVVVGGRKDRIVIRRIP